MLVEVWLAGKPMDSSAALLESTRGLAPASNEGGGVPDWGMVLVVAKARVALGATIAELPERPRVVPATLNTSRPCLTLRVPRSVSLPVISQTSLALVLVRAKPPPVRPLTMPQALLRAPKVVSAVSFTVARALVRPAPRLLIAPNPSVPSPATATEAEELRICPLISSVAPLLTVALPVPSTFEVPARKVPPVILNGPEKFAEFPVSVRLLLPALMNVPEPMRLAVSETLVS